ncbi:hypothetical protein AC579_1877 [Pseudocercospora musae]|uniref:Reverse transcriptase RNase H-like domain-containing protein n=1 Tax=Pseudocercospora musae TaxID=113226 RepID=A0A139HZ40_9PEZI|nr:hypothetical protein AC579_1877 [Pseudocercospora musae]
MNEFGNIALASMPEPQPQPSLISNTEELNGFPHMVVYVDDLLPAHNDWQADWHLIKHHLRPRLTWSRLKLSFRKVYIEDSRLANTHECERCTEIQWPYQYGTRILDWERLIPIRTLMHDGDNWQWTEAAQLAFDLVKKLTANTVENHVHDPALSCEASSDASTRGAGFFTRQTQQYGDSSKARPKPILYDAYLFSRTERNYGTYKRELRAITYFVDKLGHMVQGLAISTIYTDHKPPTGFLNAITEGIYPSYALQQEPDSHAGTTHGGRDSGEPMKYVSSAMVGKDSDNAAFERQQEREIDSLDNRVAITEHTSNNNQIAITCRTCNRRIHSTQCENYGLLIKEAGLNEAPIYFQSPLQQYGFLSQWHLSGFENEDLSFDYAE